MSMCDMKRDLTKYKEEVLKKYPSAFCQQGYYGGYRIWVRGNDPEVLSFASSARLAWKQAWENILRREAKNAKK